MKNIKLVEAIEALNNSHIIYDLDRVIEVMELSSSGSCWKYSINSTISIMCDGNLTVLSYLDIDGSIHDCAIAYSETYGMWVSTEHPIQDQVTSPLEELVLKVQARRLAAQEYTKDHNGRWYIVGHKGSITFDTVLGCYVIETIRGKRPFSILNTLEGLPAKR